MPIDFHAESNRYTYASRSVDRSWADAISGLVQPQGKVVLDIGCGGGLYSRAWARLGAKRVVGVDFSEKMARTAAEMTRRTGKVWVVAGSAMAVPLVGASADIVFERALIHHIPDPDLLTCLGEAHRLLSPGGVYLIQDRTPDDVNRPGSQNHIRGFLFEAFPKLLKIEESRRRPIGEMKQRLLQAGFTDVVAVSFWEVRRRYGDFSELAADLRGRVGRSILHARTHG